MQSDKEDMLVHEATMLLLSHFERFKALAIVNKDQRCVDGPVLGINLVRDVFYADQVDLQRVQLLAIEFTQEWLLALHLKVEIFDGHRFHFVEPPLKLIKQIKQLDWLRQYAI